MSAAGEKPVECSHLLVEGSDGIRLRPDEIVETICPIRVDEAVTDPLRRLHAMRM